LRPLAETSAIGMPLVHFKRQRNCERAVAALYREPMLLPLISGGKRRPVPALAHRHWGTDPERDGAELPEPDGSEAKPGFPM
jgi:hypothetical protein